ncbi:unnamed protein product [Fusarium fujikuroi]|uniref:Protein kinase domain-containing protein n=1 Tax=Fusarium fujikuroi TaxID=5127 RepID=A0A9Q9RBD9_FUSFU|nr:unnamed protein product [Fusarium fujikuroi]
MAKNWVKQKPWLPKDIGPKLHPFDGNLMDPSVIFLKALDVNSAHGIVVKARIGRHLYAIKFRTLTPETSTAIKDHGAAYFSPFENECRAFGRLKEQKAESIAVKVYGWVSLTTRQIRRKLAAAGAQKLNGFPPGLLYGIVKDWVEMTPYHDSKQRDMYDQMVAVKYFARMLKDLHKLHFLGIVIRDLKPDQYIDGILIDLSLASTVPHPYGPTAEGPESPWQPRWTYESLAAYDLYNFQVHRYNQKFWFSKRTRNGVQTKCTVDAYPAARCKKRCFTHTKQFVPLLNYYEEVLAMVTKPMYDPLDFLRRNLGYPVRIAQFGVPARGPPPPPAQRRTFTQIGCCAVM